VVLGDITIQADCVSQVIFCLEREVAHVGDYTQHIQDIRLIRVFSQQFKAKVGGLHQVSALG
jgi:hypothetical protein